jgi:hypothetical protein
MTTIMKEKELIGKQQMFFKNDSAYNTNNEKLCLSSWSKSMGENRDCN